MKRAGADPATVRWAQIGVPAMNAALKNGQIDAALTSYPFAAACVAEGNAIIGQPAIELMPNGGPIMMWVTTNRSATDNPAVITSFQKSIATLSAASKNKATMDKILVASTKLSKQPIEVVRAGKPPYSFNSMTKNDLKIVTDQMYKGRLHQAAVGRLRHAPAAVPAVGSTRATRPPDVSLFGGWR